MNCLADKPGEHREDESFCFGIELLPDLCFLRRVLRFGPKGQLSIHVVSPPLKGSWMAVLKNRAFGEESQPLYEREGGEKPFRWM